MGARGGGVFDRMVFHSSLAQSLGEADESAMELDDIVLRGCAGSGFVCDLVHRAWNFAAMGGVAGCALGGDSSVKWDVRSGMVRMRAAAGVLMKRRCPLARNIFGY